MSYKSTILIVDDEPVGRQLIDAILYKEGYNLEFAENGREAFEKAKLLNPDLILMDVMMPEIDGFEVCQKLRADSEMANVPIILVTALDDIDSRIRGLEAGADDYISKPFDRLELLARVKIITRLNRYRKTDSTSEASKQPDGKDKNAKNLTITKQIQESLIPTDEEFQDVFNDSFIINKKFVNQKNNLYWVKQQDNKSIFLYIDCKQAEISNSLLSILVLNTIKSNYKKGISAPEDVLNNLKDFIQENLHSNDVTLMEEDCIHMILGMRDQTENTFHYSGTSSTFLVVKNGEISELKGIDINLCIQNEPSLKFSSNTIDFSEKGISLYFLPECLNYENEENINLYNSLKEYLASIHQEDMQTQKKLLEQKLEEFKDLEKNCKEIVIVGIKA